MNIVKESNGASQGTLVDGVAASSAVDSSGERLDIVGLDISHIENGKCTANYEHKSDTPASIVGKVIYGKKIFGPEDCENERQTYFWERTQLPFVYAIVELFDAAGHEQAKEVAAILRYDESKKDGQSRPVMNFSVEGAKIKKDEKTGVVSKSIMKKLSLTVAPCNAQAIAEIYRPEQKADQKAEPTQKSANKKFDTLFKSEIPVELMKADMKVFPGKPAAPAPAVATPRPVSMLAPTETLGHEMGTTKAGHKLYTHAKPGNYKGFTSQDHSDAMNAHYNYGLAATNPQQKNHHINMAKWHSMARDRLDRNADQLKRVYPQPKPIRKSLTAGSPMGAPSTLTGGEALQKERLKKDEEEKVKYIVPMYDDIHALTGEGEEILVDKETRQPIARFWNGNMMTNNAQPRKEGNTNTTVKLAASENAKNMEKGVKQRLMPFKPNEVGPEFENTHLLRDWVTYGESNAEDPEDFLTPIDIRDSLDPIDPNAKARALHSLHGLTEVKRHPRTGERMFLMHRGVGKDELKLAGRGKYKNENTSSWTPDRSEAVRFGNGPSRVISAWIPESNIRHVPRQYGGIDQWGNPGQGHLPADFHSEAEHIVEPGTYTTAFKHKPSPEKQMHERINRPVGVKFGGEDKSVVHARLKQKVGDRPKKLAASESASLEKKAGPTRKGISRPFHLVPDHEHPSEAYFANFKNPNGTWDIHHISADGKNSPVKMGHPTPMTGDDQIDDSSFADYVSLPIIQQTYELADPSGELDLTTDHKPKNALLQSESASLEKGKNAKEEKARVWGNTSQPAANSEMRQHHMSHIVDFARKRYGLELKPSGGKWDVKAGRRKKTDAVEGVDKPDWRSGQFESQQGGGDPMTHEMAHLETTPKGLSLPESQTHMDREYGEAQKKYGYLSQKKVAAEYSTMGIEQLLRRRMGLPANRSEVPVAPGTGPRMALDDPNKVIGTRITKPSGKVVDLIRQSRFALPEHIERVDMIDRGEMTYNPELGWKEAETPNAKINRRAREASKDSSRKDAKTLMRSEVEEAYESLEKKEELLSLVKEKNPSFSDQEALALSKMIAYKIRKNG